MARNNNNLPQMEDGHKESKENSMIGPRACKICGEIGHSSKECHDEWPHCEANYLDDGYPITEVTCFLCEGTTHIPTQCQLYPMVQEISQLVKGGMHRILKRSLEVQEEKKVGDGIKPKQYEKGLIVHDKMECEAIISTDILQNCI